MSGREERRDGESREQEREGREADRAVGLWWREQRL